ncbi:ABC transporter substrate-binding protein [Neorhizobium alkalisoli]|uniref:Iron complex transport system substrate-binding protein n=1 Tax=Neorhizobium alkalisoli TaxID=528178 RepID=A0A561R8J1_9HYPH|nr:ABC transporter substrate-binding protein [Neorhizobium alkalisoli]TWF58930.1 iron complex transport system substrate-binding protein [Neorhizobium alkalisoli]
MTDSNFLPKPSIGRRQALALSGAFLLSPLAQKLGVSGIAKAEAAEQKTITITDELGREVTLKAPIKAVYPDLWYQTEIVRAIGAGDTIVAIDQTSNPKKNTANKDYFAKFASLPDAGNFNGPNWETIAASGAEVFFTRRNAPWQDAVEKLKPFGIEVVVVSTWDPKVLRAQLPNIGKIFGAEKGAADLAQLYDDIDKVLTDHLKGVEPKKVYFENNADFVTSLPGSGWHDTIVLGGGKNIFGDITIANTGSASVHTYTVDPVEIINRNPDVIIHNGIDGQAAGYAPWDQELLAGQAERIVNRPGWNAIQAVQNKNVFVFSNFFFSALGKQIGALAVAKWLYPDRLADVDVDAYFARWLKAQGIEPRPVADYAYKLGA